MKNKKGIIIGIITFFAIGFIYFGYRAEYPINKEAKNEENGIENKNNFGNDKIKEAVENYLLTQKAFSWKTAEDGHNFCEIENFSSEDKLFPIYVWVYCGEYAKRDGKLEMLSGTSLPAKINYPNELSFYDLSKFTYEIPRDGTYNAEDIKRIFPEEVRKKMSEFDKKIIAERAESSAIQWFGLKK